MAKHANKLQRIGHSAEQHRRLEQAAMRTSLECDDEIAAAADFLIELAEGDGVEKHPDLLGHSEKIKKGGTLVKAELETLEQASDEFRAALNGIRANIGDLTHERPRSMTLKSYKPRSNPGLAPHRDSNFGENTQPSLVGMVSLLGLRESALWVVPQSIILPGKDEDLMHRATRDVCLTKMRGFLGPRRIELTPFNVDTQAPGDITLIDERPKHGGVWKDAKLGTVAIWHSVYAQFPEAPDASSDPADNYVVSLITRNKHPGATIPQKP